MAVQTRIAVPADELLRIARAGTEADVLEAVRHAEKSRRRAGSHRLAEGGAA